MAARGFVALILIGLLNAAAAAADAAAAAAAAYSTDVQSPGERPLVCSVAMATDRSC